MAMIQPNFKTALLKGAIGEDIVKDILERNNWVVYEPVTVGAHCFDKLAIKNKRTAIALDVKAKARMNKYNATGINQKHFLDYQSFAQKHNMAFYLFFVDEKLGTIYGNSLKELEKPYVGKDGKYPMLIETKNKTTIRLWSLDVMKTYAALTSVQKQSLGKYNQRNYSYLF